MPDLYLSGRFDVNGLPQVNETFWLGLEPPVVFTFVQSQGSPALQSHIVIGDSPSEEELAERIASGVNHTDTNCTAEVDGSSVSVTPAVSTGTVFIGSEASNVSASGVDLNPLGVLQEGRPEA